MISRLFSRPTNGFALARQLRLALRAALSARAVRASVRVSAYAALLLCAIGGLSPSVFLSSALAAPAVAGSVLHGLTILQDVDRSAAIARGKAALAKPVVSVVEKPQPSPTGDPHDYISYAIYCWPNPNTADGLPYVQRDGERNDRQVALGDAPRLRLFLTEVPALAVAWHHTREPAYAQRAGAWLRTWMIAPATRMTPNLQGAQIHLGMHNNQGQSGGIIDAARLPELLEALMLLDGSPALSSEEDASVRAWLGDYYRWLTTSKNGREERTKPHNHGTWYLCQAASLAAFLGRNDEARAWLQEARDRIGSQIVSDGRQPLEAARVDGFSYSVYNLKAHVTLALLGETCGVDLWHYSSPNGGSLRKAIDHLLTYVGENAAAWPGSQRRKMSAEGLDFALIYAQRLWPEAGYGARRFQKVAAKSTHAASPASEAPAGDLSPAPAASVTPSSKILSVRDHVMAALQPLTQRIEAVEIYGVPVNAERRFSYEVQRGRWHLFIRFVAGGQSGWTEMNVGQGGQDWSLEQRAHRQRWFSQLKGMTPAEAVRFFHAQQDKLGRAELEAAEMAVLDLAGRLLGKPATELLTLEKKDPVPGLYCILSDDPGKVREEARRSLEQNLRTHLKVKLYGKTDTDAAVIRAAREIMGPGAYIGGDVNMGYRRTLSDAPVDDIVNAMIALRSAGLDACEDPAQMSNVQWAEVQRRCGELALIPDEPLRPAWKSRLTLDPEMGRIYNMHPNCMGSLIETVELGRVIQRAGKKLMVGDASLIGPACPVWQQLAVGLGADWVEALEKPQENAVFQRCVTRSPMRRAADGKYAIGERLPGFGIEIDLTKLKASAAGMLAF